MTQRAVFALIALACMTGCAGTEVKTEAAVAPVRTGPRPTEDFAISGRYPLALFRRFEPGDEFSIYAGHKSRQDSVATVDGKVANREQTATQMELEGTARIQTVSNDEPRVIRFRLERFVFDGEQPFPPGQVVVMDTLGTPKLSFEGGIQPTAAVITVLESALRIGPNKEDANLFGDATARALGESWSLSPEDIAKTFNKQGDIKVLPHDITGDATFVGIQPLDDQDCILVETNIHMDAFEMAKPDDSSRLEQADMRVDFDFLLPVDPEPRDRRSVKSEVTVKLKMVVYANAMEVPVTTTNVTTEVLTIGPLDAPDEG